MPAGPGRKRQRISQACEPCGNRKVKCDGSFPRCERCTSANLHCSYGISKRNKRLPPLSSPATLQTSSPRSTLQGQSQKSLSETLSGSGTIPLVRNGAPNVVSHHETAISFHDSRQLFQAYFRCIHPIWPMLYKPLYNSLDHEHILEVMSRPLVYAILSLAVLIHDRENDQLSKQERAQQFFHEALRSLKDLEPSHKVGSLVEMKSSIISCQVYTILAFQQHGIGEFSQAGTLCAIASSMAIDQSLYRRSEEDNHVEAQVKSRLWWNIYVLEKMLSCEMGRPILLRAEEADTPFPSVDESDEYELYTESAQTETIFNYKRHSSLKLQTVSAFHSGIRIAMIMESVSRQIYSITARERIRKDREAGEETRLRLWSELQDHEIAMSNSPLKLDTTGNSASLPVTVTNYVFLWSTTILLHRPFMETWRSSSSDTATSSLQNDPHEVCLYAANQICSTIEKYTRYMCGLPCDLIFPIFVAANILQRHWRRIEREDVLIRQRLELCIQWLNGLGKNWKGAESRQQMLSESINTAPDAQTADPPALLPLKSCEAHNLLHDCSNFLSVEDNFDLDYLQWVNSLDMQGFG